MSTSRTASRLVGLALALTAAFGIAAAPANANGYTASMDCGGRTLQAPLIANPAQLNALYWRVAGGQWNVHYIYTSHIDSWKWSNGWGYAGASGGFYLLPEYGQVEAWSYQWNVINGQYQQVGWRNLGTC